MSAQYAVDDTGAMVLKIRGRRIPAADYLQWQQADEAVQSANAVLAEARSEAARIREVAQREGYQAGVELAFKDLMLPILNAKAEARNILAAGLPQVVGLAEGMVRRILPRLDQAAIVRELLQNALAELSDEQQILVRVHPDHAAQATSILNEWQGMYGRCRVAVAQADPTLPAYHCVISSELGEVHLGFEQQLARLTQAALGTRTQAKADQESG